MIIISSGDIPLPLGRGTRPLHTAPVGEAFRLPGTEDPSPHGIEKHPADAGCFYDKYQMFSRSE